MSDYQAVLLAEALHEVECGSERAEGPEYFDIEEAAALVAYLNQRGWRITRTEDETAFNGPIQRALGIPKEENDASRS